MVKEERNAPKVAINPPRNAVLRIPSRSTKTPEIGDIRNVVPINKDPRRDDIVSEVLKPAFSYLSFKTTWIVPYEFMNPKITPLHKKLANITTHA